MFHVKHRKEKTMTIWVCGFMFIFGFVCGIAGMCFIENIEGERNDELF